MVMDDCKEALLTETAFDVEFEWSRGLTEWMLIS